MGLGLLDEPKATAAPARAAGAARRTRAAAHGAPGRHAVRRSGAPTPLCALVAFPDRLNGATTPLAHLHPPSITLYKGMASPLLWAPLRFDDPCPSSAGACPLVLGTTEIADKRVADLPFGAAHAAGPIDDPTPLAHVGRVVALGARARPAPAPAAMAPPDLAPLAC